MRKTIAGLGTPKRRPMPQRGEGIGDAEARRGVCRDVDEPAHDRHRPKRRDEGIDSEIGDEPAVRRADEKTGGDGADDADGNAGRSEVDHDGCANHAGKGGHGPDGKIKTAENDGEGHAAGDDSDDRVLLQDVDEVLIGPERRRRREHECDEQHEGDQDALAPCDGREPAFDQESRAGPGRCCRSGDHAHDLVRMGARRLAIPDDAPAT